MLTGKATGLKNRCFLCVGYCRFESDQDYYGPVRKLVKRLSSKGSDFVGSKPTGTTTGTVKERESSGMMSSKHNP